jgi:hypothetical protein
MGDIATAIHATADSFVKTRSMNENIGWPESLF